MHMLISNMIDICSNVVLEKLAIIFHYNLNIRYRVIKDYEHNYQITIYTIQLDSFKFHYYKFYTIYLCTGI
jgi:hypothetical protein